jgi:hypothetical protein
MDKNRTMASMPNACTDRLSSAPRDLRSGATYARARLRLGIASVGTLVVLGAGLLALGVPDSVLPDSTSWAFTDVAWLALLVGLYGALSAPFDLLGGLILPRRYGRPVAAEKFLRAWARGVAAHGSCLLAVALVLLAAGRAGGDGAALAAALVLVVVLLVLQVSLAELVGGVRRDGDRLRAPDPSFVGGIVGLPGRDRVMLSAAWDEQAARVQRVRREAVRRSGARALGIVVAALFDLACLAVVLFATSASATSVAGIATVSLWTTLWSFLGLLVLPSLSRRAVVAADRSAVSSGIDRRDLTRVLETLDAEQEDEPRRNRVVEIIFHPVPSLERRIAALAAERGPELPQPWNAARAALFLSWASLGLLSRAVHCNCGRPALWVLFPGD